MTIQGGAFYIACEKDFHKIYPTGADSPITCSSII